MQIGQSKLNNHQLFANIEVPVSDHWKVYTFGGYSYRNGVSGGFTEDQTNLEHLQDCIQMATFLKLELKFKTFLFYRN